MSVWKTASELMGQQTPPPWIGPVTRADLRPGVTFFTAGGVPMQPTQPPICTGGLILPAGALVCGEDAGKDPFNDPEEADSEVIFELDGWRIEHYKNAGNNDCDWVSHECPTAKWRYRIDQWRLMLDGVCPECCEEVPESVMGVWKLKNFDHLPNTEESKRLIDVKVYSNPNQPEKEEWE